MWRAWALADTLTSLPHRELVLRSPSPHRRGDRLRLGPRAVSDGTGPQSLEVCEYLWATNSLVWAEKGGARDPQVSAELATSTPHGWPGTVSQRRVPWGLAAQPSCKRQEWTTLSPWVSFHIRAHCMRDCPKYRPWALPPARGQGTRRAHCHPGLLGTHAHLHFP